MGLYLLFKSLVLLFVDVYLLEQEHPMTPQDKVWRSFYMISGSILDGLKVHFLCTPYVP